MLTGANVVLAATELEVDAGELELLEWELEEGVVEDERGELDVEV